jgi:A/G-specific adenine glycosylase
MPSCRSNKTFAERLLIWWDQHGRHDLPWQQSRSAYRIWVAEIMLQQTQVATVLNYYQPFLQRFPDLQTLACCDVDAVMSAWSGLGYYRRAVNLHRTAQLCLQQHAGKLPDTAEQLLQLPGIGRSTANAIISQSQDAALPILDGNLKRVLARHAGIPGWPGDKQVEQALWQAAMERLPAQRGADYSQACMDLGASLCSRSKPACNDCPVATDCRACAEQIQTQLPGRRPRQPKTVRQMRLLVHRQADQVLLEKRPATGIWASMWCLPEGLQQPETGAVLMQFSHELSHVSLRIKAVQMPHPAQHMVREGQLQWYAREDALRLGLPKPVRDILQQLPVHH